MNEWEQGSSLSSFEMRGAQSEKEQSSSYLRSRKRGSFPSIRLACWARPEVPLHETRIMKGSEGEGGRGRATCSGTRARSRRSEETLGLRSAAFESSNAKIWISCESVEQKRYSFAFAFEKIRGIASDFSQVLWYSKVLCYTIWGS